MNSEVNDKGWAEKKRKHGRRWYQRPRRSISYSTSINGMHFNPFNYGSLPQLPQIKLLCKPQKDI